MVDGRVQCPYLGAGKSTVILNERNKCSSFFFFVESQRHRERYKFHGQR